MTDKKPEFQFHKAVREQIRLLIGLSGGTGSGKTFSAMRLAKGLSGDKRFAVIDTENGRASLYAPPVDGEPASKHPWTFDFDVIELYAPFTPDRYLGAIEAAEKQGYSVIVVDSASHEWAGDGGILDMQEDELYRMAKDDYSKREACRMAAWVTPKMAHKAMVTRLLQLKAHVILCFRAEPKIEMVKGRDGKMEVHAKESLTGLNGWIPICEKNLPFELTASFLFMPDKPGVPKAIKLQEQHKGFFPLDKPITEDAGRLIGEWAKGGTPKPIAAPAPPSKPNVVETSKGVFEPTGQAPMKDAVMWFKEIEAAKSIDELKGLGVEIAKSALNSDDKATARQLFAARQKQLKNPQPPGQRDDGSGTSSIRTGPEPEPSQAAEKSEEPWI